MAYIQPDGIIQLFSDISLSPSYTDTLYFASESAKDDYFSSLASSKGITTVSSTTYTRETRGFVRVQLPMYSAYSATYMRFKNSSFEHKWFYAFVKSVEYINNECVQINFELDYIMTWMGAFQLAQCMVERQHTTTDNIGQHTEDEGISCGSYVIESSDASDGWGASNSTIRLQWADPEEAQGNSWIGIYNPTKFLDSNASGIAQAIDDLVTDDLQDNVMGVYMIPNDFSSPSSLNPKTKTVTKPYSTVAGYTPRNKKLFCFPYKYLEVLNGEGDSKQFYYERFNTLPGSTSSGSCNFQIVGASVNKVEIAMMPNNYNGKEGIDAENRITMTHFPSCCWTYDTYKAQLAQEKAYYPQTQAKNIVNGAVDTGVNAVNATIGSGNLGAGAISAVSTGVVTTGKVAKTSADYLIDAVLPAEIGSTIKGSPSADLMFSFNQKRFDFHKMSIDSVKAKMIDDYFDMYGYAIKRKQTPNMNARPHWTFVKTRGCIVHGNLPADHADMIESIFDNGIRFWHSVAELGDYSLDNRV